MPLSGGQPDPTADGIGPPNAPCMHVILGKGNKLKEESNRANSIFFRAICESTTHARHMAEEQQRQ